MSHLIGSPDHYVPPHTFAASFRRQRGGDKVVDRGTRCESGGHGRQLVGKALVVIAVEWAGAKVGRVRLRHVPDGSASSLVGFSKDVVEAGATVHTDGVRTIY